MVAKLSSVRIHDRGFLGHLGAGDTHGDADVGRLEGGGVVDAVPGHGDHVAGPLEQPDQAQLVLGGDPGHHPDVGQLGEQLVVAHGRELGPGDRPALNAELAGDGGRRGGVVAGDHPHPDAGVPALGDGRLGLGPRRVEGRRVQVALGHHHHPLAGGGHAVVGSVASGRLASVIATRVPSGSR
jgi:hypothetical protein